MRSSQRAVSRARGASVQHSLFEVQTLSLIATRVSEMCMRFGTEAFETALDDLLDRNKIAFAQLLKTNIPGGKMTFTCVVDRVIIVAPINKYM